tara:strand:+ start:4047 stop:5288 length:1242 start_codon:yes stop_codon:yes gene_type:complete
MKILLLGDTADNNYTLKKFSKKIEMRLIDFPKKQDSRLTNLGDREFFDTLIISKQIKKIKQIKNDFDLCVCLTWAAARIAYFSGMNYVLCFVGDDIINPPFENNTKPFYGQTTEKLNKKSWIERKFYKKVFDSAIACIATNHDTYKVLSSYRKDALRIDHLITDSEIFNDKINPINRDKKKFTFFSPQRIGPEKGIERLWKAISLTESDFEVLQVEWYIQRTNQEKQFNEKLLENMPSKVKLIPLINRNELGKYISFCDGILGQMETGMQGAIERDSAFCKKPVLSYTNSSKPSLIDGEEIIPPFEPKTNDPKIISKMIDKVVESAEFRNELIEKQFSYIKELSEPEFAMKRWEKCLENIQSKNKSKKRQRVGLTLFFEMVFFKITEKSILKKYRDKNIELWGKEEYQRLTKD